jgi:hypothetical protein
MKDARIEALQEFSDALAEDVSRALVKIRHDFAIARQRVAAWDLRPIESEDDCAEIPRPRRAAR